MKHYSLVLFAGLTLMAFGCSKSNSPVSPTTTIPGSGTTTPGSSTTATISSGTATAPPAYSVGNGTTAQIVTAANAFLATLDATQTAKAVYAYSSTQKSVWSNFPISDVARNGVRTGDMTDTQRKAAYALVAMLLSQKGYENVAATVNADQYLVDTTKPSWTGGTANYTIAIFGTPSPTAPWMIQFNGHHIALNATIVGANNVLTPSLTGAQPMSFPLNGQTVKPWIGQTDKGFVMINGLTTAQQAKAILSYTVNDLVLGPGNDAKTILPEGIKGADLTTLQQAQLLDLISEWTGIANGTAAATRLAELKANIADTYFAWSGPTTPGSVVYFRIQGPTVVIEYSCQQKNADHVHAMYRDPTNDYGKKL
jgi:hypothetical protein